MADVTSNIKVCASGPLKCSAMIIGEAPGVEEERERRPFVGKAGIELDRLYLPHAGLHRSQCYVTNVFKYHPKADATPTVHQIESGRRELMQEIDAVETNIIITCGTVAHGIFADTPLELQHGIAYKWFNKTIIPCYHPAAGLHQSRMMTQLLDDFDAAGMYISGKWPVRHAAMEPDIDAILLNDPYVDAFYGGKIVAIDTESGKNGEPYLVQYSVDGVEGYAFKRDADIIAWMNHVVQTADTIVMHNAKYDLRQLWKLGIYPPIERIWDTMQAAYLLGNQPKGLKALAYRHLNVRMMEWTDMMKGASTTNLMQYIAKAQAREWDALEPVVEYASWRIKLRQPQPINKRMGNLLRKIEKSNMPALDIYEALADFEGIELVQRELGPIPEPSCVDVPEDVLIRYGCADAAMTWRMYHVLRPMIEANELDEQLAIDHHAIVYTAMMEDNGVLVDVAGLKAIDADLDTRASAAYSDIQSWMWDNNVISRDKVFNPNSNVHVGYLLTRLNVHAKNTQAKYVEPLAARHPIIAKILEYKRLQKIRSTYAKPMQEVKRDGRLHSDFSLTRTDTGRLASKAPNVQNIPVRTKDGKRIRECIVAPPGWKIVVIDYSQIEMRLAGHVSADPALLDIFRTGKDIHTETSVRIFGDAEKEHRYAAKRVGFGVLYGISGKGLQELLASEGLDWSEASCQNMIDAWFRAYPGVARHNNKVISEIRLTGRVRDLFGRYRLVPEINSQHKWIASAGIRQGVNAPIQSGAAGIIKRAMGDLIAMMEMFREDVRPILQVHDELVFEVREDKVDALVSVIRDVMEQAVCIAVPTPCDVEIGDSYGVIDEWKLIVEEEQQDE
jgi:uracil-DNA glycosylase family 4